MMKIKNFQKVLKILFLALYTIILISPFFSSSWNTLNSDYSKISEEIYEEFTSSSYNSKLISVKKLSTSSSESEKFPDNIFIKIESNSSKIATNTERSNVIFAFNQSEYSENSERLKKFISILINQDLPYNSYILFVPDTIYDIQEEDSINHLSGTSSFLKDFYENDFTIAITFSKNLELKQGKYIKIIPGGKGKISPSWLIKDIINSSTQASYTYNIPPNFVLLYRNNLINEKNDVSTYLENDIPSIGLEYNNFPSLFLLQNISASLKDYRPSTWEKHYAYFHFSTVTLFINEITLVILYLIFVSTCLAILSFMFFLKNEKNERKVIKMQSTWYFSFFIIFVTYLFLSLFQKVFSSFSDSGILIFLGKTVTTLIFVFSILIVQMNFKFKISNRASAYYLIIFSCINLIIFSSLEITLLFIFFEEFIIAYICKNISKGVSQHVFSLMLIFPFIPILYSIIKYSDPNTLLHIANTNPQENFLTSLILFPIIIQWSRIAKNQKIFTEETNISLKQLILKASSIIIITSIILVLFFLGIYYIAKKSSSSNLSNSKESIYIKESKTQDFNTTLKQSGNNEFKIWNLNLESNEKIIRYNIVAKSKSSVPVYGSNFDYEFNGSNKIIFSIPDYPSNNLTLSFRANATDDIQIEITSYALKEKNIINKYIKTISLEI